jgi:2,3-dihydroxy-p-cumate/2,3-dihydroxybenzoate 3,4-dioxygenase
MLRYRRLSRVAFGVVDIERTARMFDLLEPLGVRRATSPAAGAVYRLASGDVLELHPAAQPGLASFGFEVESAEMLDRLQEALARAGVHHERAEMAVKMREPHTQATVEFLAPGTALTGHAGGIEGLGHLVFATPQFPEAVRFWRQALGFALSDEIEGRIALLRCFPNPAHHSLGIAPARQPRFHHLSFTASHDADVERAAMLLARGGTRIASGPGTHAPTGNRFVYFFDPDGMTFEVSTLAERFAEGRERAPRVLRDAPESFARDGIRRHPDMYSVGRIDPDG